MESVLVFLLLTSLCQGSEDSNISVTYPEDNQILFREQGTVVNKVTFLHVKFLVNMTGPLSELDRLIGDLTVIRSNEMQKSKINTLAYHDGNKEISSIWSDNEANELYRNRALDGVVITDMLLDLFKEYSRKIKGALMVVPENYNFHEGEYAHQRTKREAFGAILGGLALSLAIWNSYKISQLEHHFAEFSSKQNQLVDSLTLLSDKHVQLALDLKMMKDFVKMAQEHNYHKVITTSVVLSDQLRDTVERINSIITAGQQRKVSNRLITGDDLVQFFLNVTARANQMGCDMILEQPSDIYEAEASYGYDQQGKVFAIYIHVPLVERSEKLSLLEYIKFPILQSLELNSTVTPDTGDDRYIAVQSLGQTSSEVKTIPPHKFRVFSETELKSCFKLRSTYLCGGRNTLRTDIENSCIGSLWLQEHSLISKNCELSFEGSHEYATKTGPKSWLIFSPISFITVASCGVNLVKNIRIEKQTHISLPEDCRVNLKRYLLSTDVNLLVDFKVETYDWKYKGNIFGRLFSNATELQSLVGKMADSKGKYGLKDLSHLKHYYTPSPDVIGSLWESITNLKIFSFFGNLYLYACIALVAWLLWTAYTRGWLKICFGRQEKGSVLPVTRPMRISSGRNQLMSLANPSFVENRVQVSSVSKGPSMSVPPPYSSVAIPMDQREPMYPLLNPEAQIDRRYEPRAPFESEIMIDGGYVDEGECVVRNPKKGKTFICHHHAPRSATGCSGYHK